MFCGYSTQKRLGTTALVSTRQKDKSKIIGTMTMGQVCCYKKTVSLKLEYLSDGNRLKTVIIHCKKILLV